MLSRLRLTNTKYSSDAYSASTVKPLHLLHLSIFKKLREYLAIYVSSRENLINFLYAEMTNEKRNYSQAGNIILV